MNRVRCGTCTPTLWVDWCFIRTIRTIKVPVTLPQSVQQAAPISTAELFCTTLPVSQKRGSRHSTNSYYRNQSVSHLLVNSTLNQPGCSLDLCGKYSFLSITAIRNVCCVKAGIKVKYKLGNKVPCFQVRNMTVPPSQLCLFSECLYLTHFSQDVKQKENYLNLFPYFVSWLDVVSEHAGKLILSYSNH